MPEGFDFGMSLEQFEEASRILNVLEMTNFHWTIKDVLEQPEALLDRIMRLRFIGNKIKVQRQNG